jgi:hypothetical protein
MKNKTIILTFLITYILTNALSAQNTAKDHLPGSWLGKIQAGSVELRVIFNLSLVEKDSLIATLDSPDQGAKNIKLGKVTFIGESIKILAPALAGEYNGTFKSDSTFEGTWKQGGNSMPLNLKKLNAPLTINRPQEPKPPFPYTSEDVTFTNEKFNIKLAATLTIPSGSGPFKAVIMITGSGAQNRNEELMGHKPFLIISDFLTRSGIAVLRYDDRGVGGSEGKYSEATSADLATDAEAAFNFLRNNPKINPKMIGLIGHSEGGLIAPIVASANHSIGFIVSLAGPGVNGEQIILRQTQDISRLSGISESDINESTKTNRELYAILKKEKNNKEAEIKIMDCYKKILEKKNTSEEDLKKAVNQLRQTFGSNSYTWLRYFIMTNPASLWKQVKCPVLALNGDKDQQVAADENIPAIEKALKSGGNKSSMTAIIPGLNHLFQHCKTGSPSEYATIEETFSTDALEIISDWILKL